MLKQRVVTAVLLALAFVGALFFAPQFIFTAFVGIIFTLGAWEWSKLAGYKAQWARWVYALATAALGVYLAWFLDWLQNIKLLQTILLVAGVWWAVALLWIQGYPASSIIWRSALVRTVMGWVVLIPAWLACIFLYNHSHGAWLIVMLVVVVAAADIGAYFSGRTFGNRKLAPNVSPGKTWEGVIGGLLFVLLIAFAFKFIVGLQNWQALLIVVLPAALVSVVGDLLESMLKRHSGIKDSSQLLPGHGGVLDRIDGLVAAAPLFTLCLILTGWSI